MAMEKDKTDEKVERYIADAFVRNRKHLKNWLV